MAFGSNEIGLLFRAQGRTEEAQSAFRDLKTSIDSDIRAIESTGKGGFGSFAGSIGLATAAGGLLGQALGSLPGMVLNAATSLFNLAKSASDYGSALFDAQEKTGLSAETLSSLKVAADQSGSSLEALTGGIAKFSRLIGEANDGSSEAQKRLKALGVTSTDLDTALGQAITTIAKYPPGVEQMTAAQKAFGKSGADLLPFIKSFDGDLPALIAKCKTLGLTLTNEDLKAADDFGDTLDTLSAQAAAVGRIFIGPLMRDITSSMTDISDKLAKNKDAVKDWGESVAATLRGLKKVSTEIYEFSQTFAGRALSFLLFGHGILINKGLQDMGGPPPLTFSGDPLGKPIPMAIPGNALPVGPDATKQNEQDKKAAEDRAREREAAYRKEIAALSAKNAKILESERATYRESERLLEETLLARGYFVNEQGQGELLTQEKFQEMALKQIVEYGKKVQALLDRQRDLAVIGKKGTERENVILDYQNASAALNRELTAAREGVSKTIADLAKKTADEQTRAESDRVKDNRALYEEDLRNYESEQRQKVAVALNEASKLDISEENITRKMEKLEAEFLQRRRSRLLLYIRDLKEGTEEYRIAQGELKRLENDIETNRVTNEKNERERKKRDIADQQKLNEEYQKYLDNLQKANPRPTTLQQREQDPQKAALEDLSKSWKDLREEMQSTVGMGNVLSGFGKLGIEMFRNMASAVGSAVEMWALYGGSIGKALKQALAAELAHIAGVATVKALYATALGFMLLAEGHFAGAASAFKSAALWAVLAGTTAMAARALSGGGNAQQQSLNQPIGTTGSGQGQKGRGGSIFSRFEDQIIESGRNVPGQSPVRVAIDHRLDLRLDKNGVIEVVKSNVSSSGELRTLIQNTAAGE